MKETLGQRFMTKYYEYLSWKDRRDELFPELREPERKLKPKSWHYEDCPESGKIVIETPQRLRPYASSDGYGWPEIWTCADCGGRKEV